MENSSNMPSIRKRSVGITLFSWFIILIHTILLLNALIYMFFLLLIPTMPGLFIFALQYLFSLAPSLEFTMLLPSPSKGLGFYLWLNHQNIFWLIAIACGFGLLRLRNKIRLIIIIASALRITEEIFLLCHSQSLLNVSLSLSLILIQGSYIFFLTRPKVKEQFK